MQGDLHAWLDAAAGTDEEFVDRAWRLVAAAAARARRARARARRSSATARSRGPGSCGSSSRSEEFDRVAVLDGGLAFAAAERASRARRRPAAPARAARADDATSARSRSRGPRALPRRGARARHRLRVRRAGVSRRPRRARRGRARRRRSRDGRRAGLRPVVADVRELPFPDASFDLAFCISTLEHVGRDNEIYDVDAARDDAATRRRSASCIAC